jgi:hypothetical protein
MGSSKRGEVIATTMAVIASLTRRDGSRQSALPAQDPAPKSGSEEHMNRLLRIAAAILIVASGVVLFVTDDTKSFAATLIVGNLLSLAAHFREQKA